MSKAWVIWDVIDKVAVGDPFKTEEEAQARLESFSYFGDMLEVREIENEDK